MPPRREWDQIVTCANPQYDPSWWDCDGNVLTTDNYLAISLCGICPAFENCKKETDADPIRFQGTIRYGKPVPTASALRKRRAYRKPHD